MTASAMPKLLTGEGQLPCGEEFGCVRAVSSWSKWLQCLHDLELLVLDLPALTGQRCHLLAIACSSLI